MGMGHAAAVVDVVEEGFVAKMCQKEFNKLIAYLNADGTPIDRFALSLQMEEANENDVRAYNELQEAFEKKTGLSLYLGYQDPDNGDIYDDVEGSYWAVDGVYTYSKAGKKYKEFIKRAHFVTFG